MEINKQGLLTWLSKTPKTKGLRESVKQFVKKEEEAKIFIKELVNENSLDWVIENFDDMRYAVEMITKNIYTKRQLTNIRKELQPEGGWYKDLSQIIGKFLWDKDLQKKKGEVKKFPKTSRYHLEEVIKTLDEILQTWSALRHDHGSIIAKLITSTELFNAFYGLRDNAKLIRKEAAFVLASIDKSPRGGRPKGSMANPLRKLFIKELIEFYKKQNAEKKPSRRAYRFMRACLRPLGEIKITKDPEEVKKINRALNEEIKSIWSSPYPSL